MRSLIPKLSLFLAFCALVHAEPVFVGFMSSRETGMTFAVSFSAQSPTRWVKLGDTVEGYAVAEYRSKEEVLILRRDGRDFVLRLADSKVRDGRPALEAQFVRAAAELVARMDGWQSEVTYQIAKADDNFWYVFATKVVEGKKELRRVRLTPEGKATNYSKLTPLPDQ